MAGLINTSSIDHYIGLIINFEYVNEIMKKGVNYCYDDYSNNYDIQEISDYKKIISDINLYIEVYIKCN